ncbi:uncharacterized protein LMH87_007562 [Akanthomyces muscarius]|uniref:Uncharacterized protein n=1 Tax=Akanthomyces muscarius TaxID=2231603 RepID=A0A9W8QL54_AKAMU|nr:uncharacterized protein LMH87_007562 [Akanthomyces muscarius]KAJ4161526.1 hypothetical protein LMH87_007562 [Akanthomyces muscarius]
MSISPDIEAKADHVLQHSKELRLSIASAERADTERADIERADIERPGIEQWRNPKKFYEWLGLLPEQERLPVLDDRIMQVKSTHGQYHPSALFLDFLRLAWDPKKEVNYRFQLCQLILFRIEKHDNGKRNGREPNNLVQFARFGCILELCKLHLYARRGEVAMQAADRLEQIARNDHDMLCAFWLQGAAHNVQKQFESALKVSLKCMSLLHEKCNDCIEQGIQVILVIAAAFRRVQNFKTAKNWRAEGLSWRRLRSSAVKKYIETTTELLENTEDAEHDDTAETSPELCKFGEEII